MVNESQTFDPILLKFDMSCLNTDIKRYLAVGQTIWEHGTYQTVYYSKKLLYNVLVFDLQHYMYICFSTDYFVVVPKQFGPNKLKEVFLSKCFISFCFNKTQTFQKKQWLFLSSSLPRFISIAFTNTHPHTQTSLTFTHTSRQTP